MNRLVKWIARRYVMNKIKGALTELISNTSERTAVIGAILVKAVCLVPAGCTGVTMLAGWLDMTPGALFGALLTYAGLRFSSKLQKA